MPQFTLQLGKQPQQTPGTTYLCGGLDGNRMKVDDRGLAIIPLWRGELGSKGSNATTTRNPE